MIVPMQAPRTLAALVALAAASFAMGVSPGALAAADPAKVLRVASPDIATLDPQQYNDSPSYNVLVAIFEGLYEFDYLASPVRLAPLTAEGMPAISADGLTWTVKLKPGIYFTPDPAFGGKRRELTAADYVYSLQRWLDPNHRRGGDASIDRLIVGAKARVDAARKPGAKFDYDTPLEGLRALDRYTLQLKLTDAVYQPIQFFLTLGACAREVVEANHDDIAAHPVGTGAYMLKEWKRGSRLQLVANPGYRKTAFPRVESGPWAAMSRSLQGREFPRIGTVDIALIDEESVRVLEFERGNLDYIELHSDVANRLLDKGGPRLRGDDTTARTGAATATAGLATATAGPATASAGLAAVRADLASQGVTRLATPEPYSFFLYFNTRDDAVGGMSREAIALRRALALGFDVNAFIEVAMGGQSVPANQMLPPRVAGHDDGYGDKSLYDPAAANALLDRTGFKRGADGYRTRPDGRPLTVVVTLRSGLVSTTTATLMRKNYDALGVRVDFHITPFQDAIKELESGRFGVYYGGYGGLPFGYGILQQLDSRASPIQNVSRFAMPDYDRAMDAFFHASDASGQQRAALTMASIARSYVPMFPVMFRLQNEFVHPWVQGFAPQLFATYWRYLDIDTAKRGR